MGPASPLENPRTLNSTEITRLVAAKWAWIGTHGFRCFRASHVLSRSQRELHSEYHDRIAARYTGRRCHRCNAGIDVFWVGHFDLTQDMGIPGEFHHPLDAIYKVVAATRKYDKVAGINPRSVEQADEWIAVGFNAISWVNDVTVYRDALSSAVQSLRPAATAARSVAGEVE